MSGSSPEEIDCPYCRGTGGHWEFIIRQNSEVGVFGKCLGCHGDGKILRSES